MLVCLFIILLTGLRLIDMKEGECQELRNQLSLSVSQLETERDQIRQLAHNRVRGGLCWRWGWVWVWVGLDLDD